MCCVTTNILLIFTCFAMASSNAYETAIGCENATLSIECNKGELIRILHGNYGRTNPNICQIENKPYCVSPVAENMIKERCDLKRSCSIPATNVVFGDPCFETVKYAEANYTCWKIGLALPEI